ncbi:Protein kinase superfamily protein [Zea mays]|uniref:Protein kinase superfamily protein n=1 Tax=Zea mays TaxID=4577 RepID=A0A1D6KDY0_MAIZE|nr:Protein kinase superfamily protein [Zea mays]
MDLESSEILVVKQVVLFDQRYIGMTWEENTLNILLEFVPGGSIQSLLGRLGSFPEAITIIRHNQPEVCAFCLGNGYAGLKDALGSNDSGLQRYDMIIAHDNVECPVTRLVGTPRWKFFTSKIMKSICDLDKTPGPGRQVKYGNLEFRNAAETAYAGEPSAALSEAISCLDHEPSKVAAMTALKSFLILSIQIQVKYSHSQETGSPTKCKIKIKDMLLRNRKKQ